MNELIEIKPHSTLIKSVSARELYLGLGLSSDQWARWSVINIEQNEYFSQDVDFIRNDTKSNPTNGLLIKDYAISIEFAKHIAMMAKTKKSHDYRNYFIGLEKKPLTIIDYARALVESHDRIQALENDQAITNVAINDLRSDVKWIEDRLEREIENKKLYGWNK